MTIYQILSLCGIPSLILSIILSAFNYLRYKSTEYDLIKQGMVSILHYMIYTQGMLHIEAEDITTSEMKDFEYLYNAYHALGGNGTGTEIFERVQDLPIRKNGGKNQNEK